MAIEAAALGIDQAIGNTQVRPLLVVVKASALRHEDAAHLRPEFESVDVIESVLSAGDVQDGDSHGCSRPGLEILRLRRRVVPDVATPRLLDGSVLQVG